VLIEVTLADPLIEKADFQAGRGHIGGKGVPFVEKHTRGKKEAFLCCQITPGISKGEGLKENIFCKGRGEVGKGGENTSNISVRSGIPKTGRKRGYGKEEEQALQTFYLGRIT